MGENVFPLPSLLFFYSLLIDDIVFLVAAGGAVIDIFVAVDCLALLASTFLWLDRGERDGLMRVLVSGVHSANTLIPFCFMTLI